MLSALAKLAPRRPRAWFVLALVLAAAALNGCIGNFQEGDDRRDLSPGDSIRINVKAREGGELHWRVALIPQGTGAEVRVRLAGPDGRALTSGTASDSTRVEERKRRFDQQGIYALTIRNLSNVNATIQWSAGYTQDTGLIAERGFRSAGRDLMFVVFWLIVTGLWLTGSLGAAVGGSTLGLRAATRMVPEERAVGIPRNMLPERIMFDGVHAHNDFFFVPLLLSLLGGLAYFAASAIMLHGFLRVVAWITGWLAVGLLVAALCFGWALRESRKIRV